MVVVVMVEVVSRWVGTLRTMSNRASGLTYGRSSRANRWSGALIFGKRQAAHGTELASRAILVTADIAGSSGRGTFRFQGEILQAGLRVGIDRGGLHRLKGGAQDFAAFRRKRAIGLQTLEKLIGERIWSAIRSIARR